MVVRWPDVHKVLREVFAPLVGLDNVGIETPADLATRQWFIRVRRTPGSSGDEFTDFAVVDVDTFAPTYAVAEPLAEQAHHTLLTRRIHPLLDRVECLRSFAELEWGDGGTRRFGAGYEIATRRRTIA